MRKLILTGCCLLAATTLRGAAPDLSKGVFIVNEDWYGHQNSTVNYFDHNAADSEVWQYRVLQSQNPGKELGCTNQYGQIYGDRFYLIAKQAKDPGASTTGGRITVCDAKTMKVLYQSELIDPSGAQCDGRGCLGVDEHKLYISSSNGIWVFDTDNFTVKGQVNGSANPGSNDSKPNTDPTGSLYHGQCGTMVRVNDRVFAVHQTYGLLVIDPSSDKVTDIVTADALTERVLAETSIKTEKCGFGSVVLAKDGFLWVSCVKNIQGDGSTVPFIMRVDPATLECSFIRVPDGFYPPASSWYAWTPDGFCASEKENALYWNGGPNSWFSNALVYRYDIDRNEFRCVVDLNKEAADQNLSTYTRWNIYGCSMRVHPVTDELYMSLFHYFQSPVYRLRRTDAYGALLGEYDMIQNYWFPSLPVFPDNEYPVTSDLGIRQVSAVEPTTISLEGWVTDPDSQDAAIVKTVEKVSNPGMFSARIVNGNMEIMPLQGASGTQWVKIRVNSNGHVITSEIRIDFSGTGIVGPIGEAVSAVYRNGSLHVIGGVGRKFYLYTADGRVADDFRVTEAEYDRSISLTAGIYILKSGAYSVKIIVR